MEPPSMLEFHPMQGRSLPDPLAWERDPGTWTQPTRRTESASSTHKVISALTASFSIGVITSTIDLLSGNAHEEGWGARTGVLCERISVKFSGESHRGGGSPE